MAVEVKKQRARTEWRLKRMNLFDERAEFILNLEKEICSSNDEVNSSPSVEQEKKEVDNSEKVHEISEPNNEPECLDEKLESVEINTDKDENVIKSIQQEAHKDENCNVNESESILEVENTNLAQNIEECEKKKPIRPTVLDIKTNNDPKSDDFFNIINPQTESISIINSDLIQSKTNFSTKITESKTDKSKYLELREIAMSEAQRNKMRVMQHEFGLITPNNNESLIDFTVEENINANFIPSLTELQMNRLRNTQHQMENWDPLQISKIPEITTENMTEIQRNRLRNTIHRTEQGIIEKPKKTVTLTIDQEQIEEVKELGFQTPMSSATDYFTSSMNSSSIQMQSCENTPFSEISSTDIQIPTASDEIIDNSKLITESRFDHIQGKIKHPDFIGFNTDAITPSFESSLTVVDVEMLDTTSLSVYLEKSIMIPLQIQCKLVNNAMVKYLLHEHNIISHLHSLRDYFFLLNGEFAKSLTRSLFTKLYDAANPFELFNSATLKTILDRAIVSSLSSTYANSELLSLSATGLPNHLQVLINKKIIDIKNLRKLKIIFYFFRYQIQRR